LKPMEWKEVVLMAASVLAILIVLYIIWTGLGTIEVPH
jgi:hypothetical protein